MIIMFQSWHRLAELFHFQSSNGIGDQQVAKLHV
jgi:hypothetical protein